MSKIGFAGLGDIGLPMAMRLQEVAGPVTVWNRTAAKAENVLAQGARIASSPAALASQCHLVGICLTSDDAVDDVVFGKDGLLAAPIETTLAIVNLSTGVPQRSVDFAERAERLGAHWVDAPVSGGVPAASKGRLTLFLGGRDDAIATAEPLLAALGEHRTVMGAVGAGQATKLCNQMIVATNLLAIAEAVATARRAGIDVARLPQALRGGFADSAPLQVFGPRMAAHQYEPRLGAIRLMLKDIEAARIMAEGAGATSPVSDFVAETYRSIEGRNLSLDVDLAALVELFEA